MHSFLTLDLKEGVDLALNTNWRADAKSQKTEKVNKFFQQKAVFPIQALMSNQVQGTVESF